MIGFVNTFTSKEINEDDKLVITIHWTFNADNTGSYKVDINGNILNEETREFNYKILKSDEILEYVSKNEMS
jgi:hypothetical protein